MRSLAGLIIACLAFALSASAQLFEPDIPISWRIEGEIADEYPTENLPEVDVFSLLEEDLEAYHDKDEAFRFAHKHMVDFSTDDNGRWKTLANGDRIWRLGIRSSDALAMSLTFDRFYLAKGAKVYIYNQDHSEVIGPLTDDNNKPAGHLGITHISGDYLTIELYEPLETRGDNVLSIRHVAHAYRHFDEEAKRYGLSEACNVDIRCADGGRLLDRASSVVLITVDDGSRWITGTLMNNTSEDGRPLLLTSFDGLMGNPEAWVVHFKYNSLDCSTDAAKAPVIGRSLSGARLLASSNEKGFALLELFDLPPFEWNIHLAGWSRVGSRANSSSCIHHPGGDVKKIANTEIEADFIDGQYSVRWEEGLTEKGSLGAPLFNSAGQVIGWMTDGQSECGNGLSDRFMSIENAWEGSFQGDRLKDWLDPDNTGKADNNLAFPATAYFEAKDVQTDLVVYPVPARSTLNVYFLGDDLIRSTELYDISGRIIRAYSSERNIIDVNDLPRGTYVLRVSTEEKIYRRTIILD